MVSCSYAWGAEGRYAPQQLEPSRSTQLTRSTPPLGGIMSGASPAYNVEEMTYALKTANAKFLMTIPPSMDVAVTAARNAGISKERVFLLEGNLHGYTTMKQLVDIGRSYGPDGQVPSFKIPRSKQNKDVCALLSFSSGTTGLPKAVRPFRDRRTPLPKDMPGDDSSSERHCTIIADTADYTAGP